MQTGKNQWAILAVIITVTIVFRLLAIESHGLWTDEALTLVISDASPVDLFVTSSDPTPGLYYAIHGALLSEQSSLWELRSISVFFGVLSVGLVYLVGREVLGRSGGLLCALLLATAGFHIDISQEARAYSLLVATTLTATLGLLLFASDRERARPLGLALFAVGNVLSFYTHLISIFWIAPSSLILAALALSRRQFVGPTICFTSMAVGALIGIRRLLTVDSGANFTWLKQSSASGLVSVMSDVMLPAGLWTWRGDDATEALGIGIAAFLLLVGVWVGRSSLTQLATRKPVAAAVIVASLLVPIFIWLVGFVARPLLLARVIVFALPGFILFVAAVIVSLPAKRMLVGAVTCSAFALSAIAAGLQWPQEDWRGARRYVEKASSPGDVVLVCPHYNYAAVRYHSQGLRPLPVLGATESQLVLLARADESGGRWVRRFRDATAHAATAPPLNLRVQAGTSLWAIEGKCPPGRLGRLIGQIPSSVTWKETRRGGRVLVRRYNVAQPLSLTGQDLTRLGR